jgi:hypothetical protein
VRSVLVERATVSRAGRNAAAADDGQAPVPDISVSQRPAKGRPPPHGGQVPETAHPPTTHCSKIIPDFMSARGVVVCCGVSWFLIIVAEQEIPSRPAG